jgi:serine/threonine protein kinase
MTASLKQNDILKDRYGVIKHVADGGMSKIYLVEDLNLGSKKFILKSMCVGNFPDSDPKDIIEGFKREAIILANLNHPQLPRVVDYFITDDFLNFYLIMDYIEGKDLSKELQEKGMFSESKVINITLEILKILKYLHKNNIIYRDLKPSNIMRRSDGAIMLIDFGIARRIITSKNIISAQSMTTQTLVGTPGFAAREQHFGHADERSDLHALAVTMYQLLTNIPIEPDKTLKPIKQVQPNISAGLALIIDKNTDHRIDFRHSSADEMERAIIEISRENYYEFIPAKFGGWLMINNLTASNFLGCPIDDFNYRDSLGILWWDPNLKPKKLFWGLLEQAPKRVFLGIIRFNHDGTRTNGNNWVFEIYGRKYIEHCNLIADELALEFDVKMRVELTSEEPKFEPTKEHIEDIKRFYPERYA